MQSKRPDHGENFVPGSETAPENLAPRPLDHFKRGYKERAELRDREMSHLNMDFENYNSSRSQQSSDEKPPQNSNSNNDSISMEEKNNRDDENQNHNYDDEVDQTVISHEPVEKAPEPALQRSEPRHEPQHQSRNFHHRTHNHSYHHNQRHRDDNRHGNYKRRHFNRNREHPYSSNRGPSNRYRPNNYNNNHHHNHHRHPPQTSPSNPPRRTIPMGFEVKELVNRLISPGCFLAEELDHARNISPQSFESGKAITAILSHLARMKKIHVALSVWDWMEYSRIERNVFHFNSLISVCEKMRDWRRALNLLEQMEREGIQKNEVTFSSAISACEKSGNWQMAIKLLERMHREGIPRTAIAYNAAISACEKGLNPSKALEIFERMKKEGVRPTVITYSALISACEKGQQWKLALEVLEEMKTAGFGANVIAYSAAISALSKGQQWEMALELFREIEESGGTPSVVTYNATMTALEKGLQWERALDLFDEMKYKNLPITVVSYGSAISACEKGYQWRQCLEFLDEMTERGIKKNVIIFGAAMSCMEKSCRADIAFQLMDRMKVEGVIPNVHIYNSAISACARCNMWEKGLELFTEMDTVGVVRDVVTYNAVLDAVCCQVQLARTLFQDGVEKGFYARVSRLGTQWLELDLHFLSLGGGEIALGWWFEECLVPYLCNSPKLAAVKSIDIVTGYGKTRMRGARRGDDGMRKRVRAMLQFMNVKEVEQPNKGRIHIDKEALICEVEKNGGMIIFDSEGYRKFKEEETTANAMPDVAQIKRNRLGAPRREESFKVSRENNHFEDEENSQTHEDDVAPVKDSEHPGSLEQKEEESSYGKNKEKSINFDSNKDPKKPQNDIHNQESCEKEKPQSRIEIDNTHDDNICEEGIIQDERLRHSNDALPVGTENSNEMKHQVDERRNNWEERPKDNEPNKRPRTEDPSSQMDAEGVSKQLDDPNESPFPNENYGHNDQIVRTPEKDGNKVNQYRIGHRTPPSSQRYSNDFRNKDRFRDNNFRERNYRENRPNYNDNASGGKFGYHNNRDSQRFPRGNRRDSFKKTDYHKRYQNNNRSYFPKESFRKNYDHRQQKNSLKYHRKNEQQYHQNSYNRNSFDDKYDNFQANGNRKRNRDNDGFNGHTTSSIPNDKYDGSRNNRYQHDNSNSRDNRQYQHDQVHDDSNTLNYYEEKNNRNESDNPHSNYQSSTQFNETKKVLESPVEYPNNETCPERRGYDIERGSANSEYEQEIGEIGKRPLPRAFQSREDSKENNMYQQETDVPNKNGFYEQSLGRNNGRIFSQSEHINPHHESNSLYEKTNNGYNDREGERYRESNEKPGFRAAQSNYDSQHHFDSNENFGNNLNDSRGNDASNREYYRSSPAQNRPMHFKPKHNNYGENRVHDFNPNIGREMLKR